MGTTLLPIRAESRSGDAVDVVFVHGLGGDGLATWSASDSVEDSWLFWLADDHPDWAIWSLDYRTAISSWQGSGVVGRLKRKGPDWAIPELGSVALDVLRSNGIGNRAVVFVCHSLGGLVVKSLLSRDYSTDGAAVLSNTRGVVFIATPHSGSGLASMAKLLPNLARTTRTVMELESESPYLAELKARYSAVSGALGIETKAYAELKPIAGATRVVSPSSADPGNGEPVVVVDQDHSSIVKPTSRDDTVFRGVERFIHGSLQKPTTDVSDTDEPTRPPRRSDHGALDHYSAFISYAPNDREAAIALQNALFLRGVAVWVSDTALVPGDDLDAAVTDAISQADRVILLGSRESLTSWMVERELERATAKEQELWQKGRLPRGMRIVIPVDLDGYLHAEYAGKFSAQLRSTSSARLEFLPNGQPRPEQVDNLIAGLIVADARTKTLPRPKL